MAEREHDIVVFGGTGFTGRLTAEYLARHAPADTRVALAGRDATKLEHLRSELASLNPAWFDLPLISADVDVPATMRFLAESTRVVITTVGPFSLYGEPMVAACAAAGTSYVDLAGEPEFVDRMWLRYHQQAQSTGARLVHSCGFESIPYDLGVLFTVQRLPDDAPIHIDGFMRAGGGLSGGTFHAMVHGLGRLRQTKQVARQRHHREDRPRGRTVKGAPGKPHDDPVAGGWVVPFPTIDAQTVLRSARALDRYGTDFSYSHYLLVKRLPMVIGFTAGTAALIACAQVAPARRALLKLKRPGDGPSREQREKSWFAVRLAATAADTRLVTEVSGGDPGYGETSKMLAESALCLAHDELPERAGQLTPAVAMGDRLRERLEPAGIRFESVAPRTEPP